MNVPQWAAELVRAFWAEAGTAESFPRALRRAVARSLPVSIVLLPRLRLSGVRCWLRENRVACVCDERDRPLRACLAASRGYGLIFLDGTDEENEQRFSLAHETAHFLRHYWHPRRRACQRLGEQVAEVLDGERAPTERERVHALLRSIPLEFHLHLMRRGPRCEVVNAAVARAEEEADLLAYELLAPAADVLRVCPISHRNTADTAVAHREPRCATAVSAVLDPLPGQTLRGIGTVQGVAGRVRLTAALQSDFGLPTEQAADYSRRLLPPVWEDPLLRRLRP